MCTQQQQQVLDCQPRFAAGAHAAAVAHTPNTTHPGARHVGTFTAARSHLDSHTQKHTADYRTLSTAALQPWQQPLQTGTPLVVWTSQGNPASCPEEFQPGPVTFGPKGVSPAPSPAHPQHTPHSHLESRRCCSYCWC
jgi:hypothetical protein